MKTTIILSSLIIAIGIALSGGIYKVTNSTKLYKVKTNVFTGYMEIVDLKKLHRLHNAKKELDESDFTIIKD